MIITFATYCIAFSLVDAFVEAIFHSYNGCFIYFTLSTTFGGSKRAGEIGLLVYCGVYSTILASLAVQFFYRAVVIAAPNYVKYFNGWNYIFCILYAIICGIAWPLNVSLTYPDEMTDAYMKEEMLSNYGVKVKDVANYVVLAYNGEGESKTLRWNSVACILSVSSLLSFQYMVMLISGILVYREIQRKSRCSESSKHEKLQKQVFVALVYQVAAPTIFIQLPSFIVLTIPFLDLKFSFRGAIIIYGYCTYPFVDFLIILKVITEYRNAYKRFLIKLANRFIEILGYEMPTTVAPSTTAATISRTLARSGTLFYVITVFLNTSLIHLTLFHTKQIVGTYRKMIVTFALIGIAFSTLDMLVRPLFHSYNGCFIYFTLGSTFRSSKRVAEFGLLIYSAFYSMILAFLAVQFLYRACVISKPYWTKYFDGWKYIFWLFYTFLGGLLWSLASTLTFPDEATLSYMRNEILQNYGVEIKNVPHFAVLAYNGEGPLKTIRWNSLVCIGCVSAILVFQYSIMLVSGIIMYRKTQGKLTATSSEQERMQRQFFNALILQVAAPTIFFQLPGFVVLVFPFFDFKLSFHSGIVTLGFNAYPMVDTLIVLKVVTEYKNAYKRFIQSFAKDCIEFLGGDTPRNPPATVTNALAKL
ncbi:hypothetical protein GCK72_016839 [Caenorhabditis remanei]|uniref:Serpentine receptor class r-10 n=1 Tax=Caenorhabditis remanei TaxID=31234 RepID=A0A6A5G6F4_CAERE|nr:hypothetical protein GCK72_016839 [Caenorhabditis remanei]KAF1750291.1 hypothetical protein GCK72_016839 [Caenorhabditis remanei]